MNYSGLPFYTIDYSVSEQNQSDFYKEYSSLLNKQSIATLGTFRKGHYCVSGKNHLFPEFLVSDHAKSHLIYPQGFCLLEANEKYYTDRQDLASYELRYTLSGEGYLEYNGNTYLLRKGDGYWIDCRKKHFYRTNSASWESTILHFWGGPAHTVYEEYASNNNVKFSYENFPDFENLQMQILRTSLKNVSYYEYKLSCLFNLLITELLISSNTVHENSERQAKIMSEMITYIKENYAQDLTINFLSKKYGISPAQFHREFPKYTGFTPKQYILSLRLSHAKRLLQTTSESIDRIAEMIGFRDTAHFIQIFKKEYHITPLQYRKSSIQIHHSVYTNEG